MNPADVSFSSGQSNMAFSAARPAVLKRAREDSPESLEACRWLDDDEFYWAHFGGGERKRQRTALEEAEEGVVGVDGAGVGDIGVASGDQLVEGDVAVEDDEEDDGMYAAEAAMIEAALAADLEAKTAATEESWGVRTPESDGAAVEVALMSRGNSANSVASSATGLVAKEPAAPMQAGGQHEALETAGQWDHLTAEERADLAMLDEELAREQAGLGVDFLWDDTLDGEGEEYFEDLFEVQASVIMPTTPALVPGLHVLGPAIPAAPAALASLAANSFLPAPAAVTAPIAAPLPPAAHLPNGPMFLPGPSSNTHYPAACYDTLSCAAPAKPIMGNGVTLRSIEPSRRARIKEEAEAAIKRHRSLQGAQGLRNFQALVDAIKKADVDKVLSLSFKRQFHLADKLAAEQAAADPQTVQAALAVQAAQAAVAAQEAQAVLEEMKAEEERKA